MSCKIKDNLAFASSAIADLGSNLLNMRREYTGDARVDGRVIVITGANTGMGKETAYQLSIRGAKKIYIGCRDGKKAEEAINDIKERNPKANLEFVALDLASLESVRDFAKKVSEQESKVDILINNAGVMMCPEWKTKDGFEMQFGTNHLGHFLLTLSLLPIMRNAPKARIITVSSAYMMKGEIYFNNINLENEYEPTKAYNQSKLANVLFTRELARRLGKDSNITTYCLHPGAVSTDLQRHNDFGIMQKMFIDVTLGCQTALYCTLQEGIEKESGSYYENCKRVDEKCIASNARNDEMAEKLWDLSCDLVKLDPSLMIPKV